MRTESAPALSALAQRFAAVRALSAALVDPLSDADATVQSMDDASPAKWHLAHTSWFFETFVLRDHVPGYTLYDGGWPFLFNSYYEAEGDRHARPMRGMLTRPSLAEILDYRSAVDAALLAALPGLPPEAQALVQLGCHHEEQHQELLLTDILHLFSLNPLQPALWPGEPKVPVAMPGPVGWIEGRTGEIEVGKNFFPIAVSTVSTDRDFCFDCEGPRHRVLLTPHAIADRTVTNGEWAAFIADGGYADPRYWLSDGWAWVKAEGIRAPLYWEQVRGGWTRFGLDGRRPLDPAAPVTHVSFSRPMPMPAGPAPACLPRPNGKPRLRRMIRAPATSSTPPARSSRGPPRAAPPFSAMSGNGPAAPIALIRASGRPGARSANIMASS